MKIGDEVYIHGYVDEIRKDTIIIKNEGGYFGTVKDEIKQKPKSGHWIKENPPMVEQYPFCSECGFVNPFENALNYCPNCGEKMEGEE